MWPYDTAEADWLADGDEDATRTPVSNDEKAAAQTATVFEMTEMTRTAIPAPANSNTPASRGGILGRMIEGLRSWRARADARETLYGMTDRELRDIGLSRDDIMAVTARRAPAIPASIATGPVHGNAMGAGVMGNALMGLTRGATGWDSAA
jgi:uncharacterized protein YjiS (DUF1127 family)